MKYHDRLVGFWGAPSSSKVLSAMKKYHATAIDLDVDIGNQAPDWLPRTTCSILTNIVANAMALKDRLCVVLGTVDEGKCSGAREIGHILAMEGVNVTAVPSESSHAGELHLCQGRMPLKQKILRIMDMIRGENGGSFPEACKPSFGFWGVPPNDIDILDLFPDTTHVYGWTRCVEAGRPADLELEMYVDPGIPTVFYCQAFCAKQAAGRYLAHKMGGLFIDCDAKANSSDRDKIEAFIMLHKTVGDT